MEWLNAAYKEKSSIKYEMKLIDYNYKDIKWKLKMLLSLNKKKNKIIS